VPRGGIEPPTRGFSIHKYGYLLLLIGVYISYQKQVDKLI